MNTDDQEDTLFTMNSNYKKTAVKKRKKKNERKNDSADRIDRKLNRQKQKERKKHQEKDQLDLYDEKDEYLDIVERFHITLS